MRSAANFVVVRDCEIVDDISPWVGRKPSISSPRQCYIGVDVQLGKKHTALSVDVAVTSVRLDLINV